MPKISVIMPIYNKVRYIEKSVNSILNQTYENFELIIVDDGSSDGSEIICDKFAKQDLRIKVFHIENGGASNARNIGLEKATGDYIQFIDADDFIEHNMFKNLVDIIKVNRVDIIISGIKKISMQENNINILQEVLPKQKGKIERNMLFENFAYEQYKTGIYGFISNKLIRKKIIDKNKIRFNNNIKLAEDYEFFLHVYENIRNCYFIQYSFYNYIQDTDNNSLNKDTIVDYMCQIQIQLYAKQIIERNNPNKENLKWINCNITRYIYCYLYNLNFNKYTSYSSKYNYITINKDIINSISYLEQPIFNSIVLFLFKNNIKIGVYFSLVIYKLIFAIYHNIKHIIYYKLLKNKLGEFYAKN